MAAPRKILTSAARKHLGPPTEPASPTVPAPA